MVDYTFEWLQRGFWSKELKEFRIENEVETNYVISMNNRKMLSYNRNKNVKYANVTLNCESIDVVRISQGYRYQNSRYSMIRAEF